MANGRVGSASATGASLAGDPQTTQPNTHRCQVSDRRYLSEGSMALLTNTTREVPPAKLMAASTPNADPHGSITYTTPRDVTADDHAKCGWSVRR